MKDESEFYINALDELSRRVTMSTQSMGEPTKWLDIEPIPEEGEETADAGVAWTDELPDLGVYLYIPQSDYFSPRGVLVKPGFNGCWMIEIMDGGQLGRMYRFVGGTTYSPVESLKGMFCGPLPEPKWVEKLA